MLISSWRWLIRKLGVLLIYHSRKKKLKRKLKSHHQFQPRKRARKQLLLPEPLSVPSMKDPPVSQMNTAPNSFQPITCSSGNRGARAIPFWSLLEYLFSNFKTWSYGYRSSLRTEGLSQSQEIDVTSGKSSQILM